MNAPLLHSRSNNSVTPGLAADAVNTNGKEQGRNSNEYIAISNGGDKNAPKYVVSSNNESVTHSEKAEDGSNFEIVATDKTHDRIRSIQSLPGKEQVAEKVMDDNENNPGVSVEKKDADMADAFSSFTKEQATTCKVSVSQPLRRSVIVSEE
eukprot:15333744-Ditylum_brightwellii.AAC.2